MQKTNLDRVAKKIIKNSLNNSFLHQLLSFFDWPDREPVKEYLFHPSRKWRFDFAWPGLMIAVEIEGGTWIKGGHNRGGIYKDNCDKYNEATRLGWKVFRFTTDHIKSGYASKYIYAVVNDKEIPSLEPSRKASRRARRQPRTKLKKQESRPYQIL